MKPTRLLIAATLLSGMCGTATASVSASLERDRIAEGETVELSLQHDGQGGGEPDLAPLKKDFDVLGSSTSSNIQLVNGHMSSQRELILTLSPKHAGNLQIPSLSWDGEHSQALSLSVGGTGTGTSAADQGIGTPAAPVFLTGSVDQTQPYVQGTAVLTVQVHAAQSLYQANLDFTGNSDLAVQQIGKDRQFSETRNGRRYDVIERKYLLLPQRSGKISLDGPTLDAQVAVAGGMQDPFGQNSPFGRAFGGAPFAGMFNTAKPLRLHGEPIELDVRPRPAAASGRDWLPATQLGVEQSWKPDGGELHVGDPVTLHLRLRATGLTGAQLPDLGSELALPDGLKAYPDQAKLGTELEGGAVVGTREQDIAIIADRPGVYEVPALRLQWWDMQREAQREVTLAPHSLDVLPAAGTTALPAAPLPVPAPSSAAPAPTANEQRPGLSAAPATAWLPLTTARSVWFWVSLVLGLLWIATLYAWWRKRPAVRTPSSAGPGAPSSNMLEAGAARRAFQQACRNHDPVAARRCLLGWARATWPEQPAAGLEALSRRVDPAAAPLLRELDRACFAGGAWNGEPLLQNLQSLEAERGRPQLKPALPNLYS